MDKKNNYNFLRDKHYCICNMADKKIVRFLFLSSSTLLSSQLLANEVQSSATDLDSRGCFSAFSAHRESSDFFPLEPLLWRTITQTNAVITSSKTMTDTAKPPIQVTSLHWGSETAPARNTNKCITCVHIYAWFHTNFSSCYLERESANHITPCLPSV